MKANIKGVTLLEVLLVLAILGALMSLLINYGTRQVAQERRDKTAIQTQQILSAGLAYYTSFSTWPLSSSCGFKSTSSSNGATGWSDLSALYTNGYLPSSLSKNAYGGAYQINCDTVTQSVFYVISPMDSTADALAIAGELPVGYQSDQYGNSSASGTYVTSQVALPGQNLNNARSVNFSGIYHHGACVPVPACPGYDNSTNACISGSNCMTPEILVAPVSVSGVNIGGSTSPYPITSFTAYALGPGSSPAACDSASTTCPGSGVASATTDYWRVCMQVVTLQGDVATTNSGTGASAWGQYATVMAITRCVPPSEPYGSDLTVFSN